MSLGVWKSLPLTMRVFFEPVSLVLLQSADSGDAHLLGFAPARVARTGYKNVLQAAGQNGS
ncbi:MAG: hypothetical protein A2030_06555 [Chloroflexi bacterium RBG_19FT_COMBO_50_10]|nr:MAG: hypothetical protein A2030_06555 [Chloroflexi bacterium RBG_19FT_COMBO_50_10]